MTGDFREQPHARARGKAGEDDAVRWLEGEPLHGSVCDAAVARDLAGFLTVR